MENHILSTIKTKFSKLENRLARIELLLRKDVAQEKKIKSELKKLEKEEKVLGKAEASLEKDEKQLLKKVKKIEAEEDWDSGTRFYCKSKVMDDNYAVVCSKLSGKKPCVFKNCPIK
jgi:chromosome segregation ATPase